MIDIATYKKMHPNDSGNKQRLTDELGKDAMERDRPPDEFLLLLSPTIYGFNIQEKKWSKRS
jgi:hypothetical protein